MKQIILDKNNSSSKSLYIQLYDSIKEQILSGDIVPMEKMPSVRGLATLYAISTTTVIQAYEQLLSEGYIKSKPGSGYFAENISPTVAAAGSKATNKAFVENAKTDKEPVYLTDPESFDFIKWKKCLSNVFTEKSDLLLTPAKTKGELPLRREIAEYLFHSRGVHADAENIIIAAGTQQTALQLTRLLHNAGINIASVEKPGYAPVRSMFAEGGFTVFDIPVTQTGIEIDRLPVNIPSAVYVNPSNQFPTGAVMPISARQNLLSWAKESDSYIIEDDYDSELRYFGRPMPTLKALDTEDRVIYLGSFSSTLFASVKISYMVLPHSFAINFDASHQNFTQACSKAEQLALADYMHNGYYYTTIRKKRALFTKKLEMIQEFLDNDGQKRFALANAGSGLSVILRQEAPFSVEEFKQKGRQLGIRISPIEDLSNDQTAFYSLYYTDIPLNELYRIKELLS